jgi:hypothetical protein
MKPIDPMDFHTQDEKLMSAWRATAAGVLLNSALYLAAVFVAGVVDGNHLARNLAIAAMGATYLCYIANLYSLNDPRPRRVMSWPLVLALSASIAFGASAGFALLVR